MVNGFYRIEFANRVPVDQNLAVLGRVDPGMILMTVDLPEPFFTGKVMDFSRANAQRRRRASASPNRLPMAQLDQIFRSHNGLVQSWKTRVGERGCPSPWCGSKSYLSMFLWSRQAQPAQTDGKRASEPSAVTGRAPPFEPRGARSHSFFFSRNATVTCSWHNRQRPDPRPMYWIFIYVLDVFAGN